MHVPNLIWTWETEIFGFFPSTLFVIYPYMRFDLKVTLF